jgi:hypothetical protein
MLCSVPRAAVHAALCCGLVAALAVPHATMLRAQSPVAAALARGILAGTVIDDATSKPVANAEITIASLKRTARSDSSGNFTIAEIPVGLHAITINASGFAPFATRVPFADGQRVESDFALRPGGPATVLSGVETRSTSSAGGPLAGFEERRKSNAGRYITQDVLEGSRGRKFADILRQKIPGIAIISNNGQRSAATASRGASSITQTPGAAGTKKECYAQVIVDGIIVYASARGDRLFDLDGVDPSSVAGVEFYTVSQTPSQFNASGTAPCGTLLIWSRR